MPPLRVALIAVSVSASCVFAMSSFGVADAATVLVVAKDGSGNYSTVQAAINAVPTSGAAYTIEVQAGTYDEVVSVPADKPNLTIEGATGNAEDVVIAAGNAAWMTNSSGVTLGTEGSATATFAAKNFTLTDITVANTYNPADYTEGYAQAVAINAEGDRQTYTGDRFTGLQDTLLAWAPIDTDQYRQLFEDDFIEGDIDFIFGNSDAVFYADNIKLTDRGATAGGVNGYLTASATDETQTYGFLIDGCSVTSTAADNTFYLGRPWHPDSTANPQIVIRNTALPAQIKTADPWTTMSGYSFTSGRYYEYDNTGSGATVNSDRPQLTTSQAAAYTPQKYLAGNDGWNPLG